jgi:hypothetical protein
LNVLRLHVNSPEIQTDKKQPGGAPNFRRRQLPHPNMHEAAKLRRMYILGFAATQ